MTKATWRRFPSRRPLWETSCPSLASPTSKRTSEFALLKQLKRPGHLDSVVQGEKKELFVQSCGLDSVRFLPQVTERFQQYCRGAWQFQRRGGSTGQLHPELLRESVSGRSFAGNKQSRHRFTWPHKTGLLTLWSVQFLTRRLRMRIIDGNDSEKDLFLWSPGLFVLC